MKMYYLTQTAKNGIEFDIGLGSSSWLCIYLRKRNMQRKNPHKQYKINRD